MMKACWSKAPVAATHYDPRSAFSICWWRIYEPTKAYYYFLGDWIHYGTHPPPFMRWMEPRPEPETPVDNTTAGVNEFGLDVGYFTGVIERELADVSRLRPSELALVCARIARTADASVLVHPDFVGAAREEQKMADLRQEKLAEKLHKTFGEKLSVRSYHLLLSYLKSAGNV